MKEETTAPTGAEPRMLSADEVREIAERADKATPGPWGINKYGGLGAGEFNCNPVLVYSEGWEDCRAIDPDFIAKSRTDIPNLCHTVERLRDRAAELEQASSVAQDAAISIAKSHAEILAHYGRLYSKVDRAIVSVRRAGYVRLADEHFEGLAEHLKAAPMPQHLASSTKPNNDAEIARLAREFVAASKEHTRRSIDDSVQEFAEARNRLFKASRALIAAVEQEGR